MKQLVVISGKGGTGKTTLTASFAALAKNKVICDCDVDAADLFLLLDPSGSNEEDISLQKKARIDPDKCTRCGKCVKSCRFDAISDDYTVDGIKCEGCGVCGLVCPSGAVVMSPSVDGKIITADTRYGPFFYARLKPGSGNSGKLVTEIKKRAFHKAGQAGCDLIIIDGSPGIGCPVIASLAGADLALIVTEPTLSGEHDLKRVLELAGHFRIKPFVVINKSDINPQNAGHIKKICGLANVKFVFEIPYDPVVTKSMIAAKPLVEFADNGLTGRIKQIWGVIHEELF